MFLFFLSIFRVLIWIHVSFAQETERQKFISKPEKPAWQKKKKKEWTRENLRRARVLCVLNVSNHSQIVFSVSHNISMLFRLITSSVGEWTWQPSAVAVATQRNNGYRIICIYILTGVWENFCAPLVALRFLSVAFTTANEWAYVRVCVCVRVETIALCGRAHVECHYGLLLLRIFISSRNKSQTNQPESKGVSFNSRSICRKIVVQFPFHTCFFQFLFLFWFYFFFKESIYYSLCVYTTTPPLKCVICNCWCDFASRQFDMVLTLSFFVVSFCFGCLVSFLASVFWKFSPLTFTFYCSFFFIFFRLCIGCFYCFCF